MELKYTGNLVQLNIMIDFVPHDTLSSHDRYNVGFLVLLCLLVDTILL